MHVVIQIQPFRRKPKKLKSLFSRNKQRSKDIKHLTTASEIKSCQGHLVQKHKPQEMITQYACNKPASWPLNIRFSAAKTRFTQSKFRMLHLLHCVVLVTFAREKKEREPLFKQTLKVTFHIITSLWVVFGLSTLISYCDIFRQCSVITRGKKSHSGYWFCRRKLRENISNLLRKTLTRTTTCQWPAITAT